MAISSAEAQIQRNRIYAATRCFCVKFIEKAAFNS
jgi:hypothetical protein